MEKVPVLPQVDQIGGQGGDKGGVQIPEHRLLCLTGYEPLLDACAVCGAPEPLRARLHLSQGVLCCAACRGQLGGGVSMPLSPGALAAARYIVSGPPKKLFSFALAEESLRQLGQATEAFLMTQQERGFRTLDYYKQLERSLPEAGRG